MATHDGSGTAAGAVDEIRAEVDAVIETAGKVAHEGLDPRADSVRVLAGLVLKLAEQVARLLDGTTAPSTVPSGAADRSPNEVEAPTEEDITPEDAPAEPARPL